MQIFVVFTLRKTIRNILLLAVFVTVAAGTAHVFGKLCKRAALKPQGV